MNELSKIKRVMQKVVENAPHDVLLILDGSTGQNAFQQAKEFTKATEVTSLAITKLDGTAKGGVVIGISEEFNIPVNYIGVGEGVDDLQVFNKFEFVDSFFKQNSLRTKSLDKNIINVITLGCSKNIYDSEVLMGQLKANKKKVVHEKKGNIVVINTCGFIDNDKEE